MAATSLNGSMWLSSFHRETVIAGTSSLHILPLMLACFLVNGGASLKF